jgi:hypothetical protein
MPVNPTKGQKVSLTKGDPGLSGDGDDEQIRVV